MATTILLILLGPLIYAVGYLIITAYSATYGRFFPKFENPNSKYAQIKRNTQIKEQLVKEYYQRREQEIEVRKQHKQLRSMQRLSRKRARNIC